MLGALWTLARKALTSLASNILGVLNPARRYLLPSSGANTTNAPSFDLTLAVPLAVLAFDAYSPPTQGSTPVTHSGPGTSVTCLDEEFLRDVFSGVLEVQVLGARGLRNADFMPGDSSDPFALVTVGMCSGRTSTIQNCQNPQWDERKEPPIRLPVRNVDEGVLEVRLYDADLRGMQDDLGRADLPLRDLAGQQQRALTLPLTGPGAQAGATVTLRARLSSWRAEEGAEGGAERGAPGAAAAAATAGLTAENATDERKEAEAGLGVAQLAASLAEEQLGKSPDAAAAAAARAVPPPPAPSTEAARWCELSQQLGAAAAVRDLVPLAFLDHPGSGTQGWIHRNRASRTLVIAFRGTQPDQFQDVLSDLRLAPVFPAPLAPASRHTRLHRGFLAAYTSLRPTLTALLAAATAPAPTPADNNNTEQPAANASATASAECAASSSAAPPWRILVTGHSLGGALATLAAYDLKKSDPSLDIACYTFGAPRVGNRYFAAEYDSLLPNTFRVVNKYDIVASVPFSLSRLLDYTHVGRAVQPEEAGGRLQVVSPGGEVGLKAKVSRGLSFAVSQHMGTTYQATLAANLTAFLQPAKGGVGLEGQEGLRLDVQVVAN